MAGLSEHPRNLIASFLLSLAAVSTPTLARDSEQLAASPGSSPGFNAGFLGELRRFRDNVDFRFRDRILSPLPEADRRAFRGLDYFEPAPELALAARLERATGQSVS